MTLSCNTAVYEFDRAIVRKPAASVVHGLRDVDRGDPDFGKLQAEHEVYVKALQRAGLAVQTLAADERFPDSVFVEDPALVFTEGAILLRPGAPSRLGEAAALKPALVENFPEVLEVSSAGFADGGDVLVTARAVLIGLSSRTDAEGAASLSACLERLGRSARIVQTPPGVLHFKTDCSLLDDETVLTTSRLSVSGVFDDYRKIIVPDGEEAAANALRINDVVLVGGRFQRTIDLLDGIGYPVVAMPADEIGKIDAGLSCMSLRWHSGLEKRSA